MSPSDDLQEIGFQLHRRLLSGDPTAFAEIAEAFLPYLTGSLTKRYPNLVDPHLVDTAVVDALYNYLDRPSQYDPERLSLGSYLLMSAGGDLRNLTEKHKKDSLVVNLAELVELDESSSEYRVEVIDDSNVEDTVMQKLSPTWKNLRDLLPGPIDQELLFLMMDGIRETNIFADVLGIGHLPGEEQFKIVKRHKDRIKKTIRRNIEPGELRNE